MLAPVSSRVACLRSPWFAIDVLARDGLAAKGSPIAVIRGAGTHARVALASPAARAAGVRAGQSPSEARALARDLALTTWDEARIAAAMAALGERLEAVTPRLAPAGPGCFWLEPVVSRGEDERAFAARLLEAARGERLTEARVAIADGPVAASAAARTAREAVTCLPPGGDAAFLAGLPIELLGVGPAMRELLVALGVRTGAALQAMDPGLLEARFGPEGRRLWLRARGQTRRRPLTPRGRPEHRVEVPLLEATAHLEPVLFVLRGAIDRVARAMAGAGAAVARLRVTLVRERGEATRLELAPSRPSAEGPLLFELVRARLAESPDGEEGAPDWTAHPVTDVVVEVGEGAPLNPLQGDLFAARWRDPVALEAALARLTGRFGEGAVAVPVAVDTWRPERAGIWRPVAEAGAAAATGAAPSEAPAEAADGDVSACVRLLPEPAPVRLDAERRQVFGARARGPVTVTAWRGPERLSGEAWGEDPWDRDYFWLLTAEAGALWVYRDRRAGGWFLHGWLD